MTWKIQKSFRLLGLSVLLSFCSLPSYAGNLVGGGLFFGAGIGGAWSDLPDQTTVFNGSPQPAPYNQDTYSISEPDSVAVWPVYFGYRFARDTNLFPYIDVSLRYEHVDSFTLNGTIDQYSLPDYVNYNYSLDTVSNLITIDGRTDVYRWGPIAPYVSGGLGVAVNTTSGYSEQAFSGIYPRVSPGFQNNTDGNFTGDIGFGVDYFITHNIWASLGYEYAYLGKVQTGNCVSTWSGETLSPGSLTSNMLLFGLFYQFVAL